MSTNRFGLSRHIPKNVASEVRRRSKFGCVICRCAICQYEHIEPEFNHAKEHDPEHICLLCGGCHDRVTRGRLSKETVKKAYLDVQTSNSLRPPFEELDLSCQSLTIEIGTSTFTHTKTLISINGENILGITPAQEGARFPTLNGVFYDRSGRESCRITDNVWEGSNQAWDIEVVGTRVTVKTDDGKIALLFDLSPPNRVHIRSLDMYKDNCHLIATEEELFIGQTHEQAHTYIGLKGFTGIGCEAAISVDSRSGVPPVPSELRMIGGEGIILDGTGIRVAVGAGSMTIGRIRLLT